MSLAAPNTPDIETIPTHPEEMKAVFNLRMGKSISLQGSARMTPAGVVTAGITAFAVLAGLATLMRGLRR